MSIPSIGAVSPSIAGSGVNIDQLADLYRSQIMAGSSLNPSSTDSISSALGVGGSTAASAATTARGAQFGNLIQNSLSQLESLDKTAQNKAIQAATGDLTDIQDYVIAATKAQTATELTTTVRNKALDSFNEIMRMSL
jgi:flagellar hook-basal body complex protein FliE